MKTSALSQRTAPAESSFNLIHKDLVSQLRSTVLDFYSWQREQVGRLLAGSLKLTYSGVLEQVRIQLWALQNMFI